MGKITCIAVLVCVALLNTVHSFPEENERYFDIPAHLRCDSCMAVAHHFYHALQKRSIEKGKDASKTGKEDVLKTLENSCKAEDFRTYAVVEVKSKERLVGPGIDMGVIGAKSKAEDSKKWADRLSRACVDFTEKYRDRKEDGGVIYKIFKEHDKKRADFQNEICKRATKFCRVSDEL